MNWLDIVLLIVLALSVIAGFMRGFARIGIGLAAFVLALILSFWFYGTVGSFLLEFVASKEVANLIGFFVIFFGVLILGAMVARLISKFLKFANLSWLDRLLGAGIGVVRGILIAAVIVIGISAFAPKSPPQSVLQSHLAPRIMGGARIIVAAAPRDLRQGFERTHLAAKRLWSEGSHPYKGKSPKSESY